MDALGKALTVTPVCIMSKELSMLSPLQTKLPSKTGRERNTDGHTKGWEIISETQQTYHEKAAPIEFSHERTSHAKYLFFLFSGSAMTTTHNGDGNGWTSNTRLHRIFWQLDLIWDNQRLFASAIQCHTPTIILMLHVVEEHVLPIKSLPVSLSVRPFFFFPPPSLSLSVFSTRSSAPSVWRRLINMLMPKGT